MCPVSPLFVMLSQLDCFQETCEGDFQGIPWRWMPRVKALALHILLGGLRDLLLRFQGTCFCLASHIHSCCDLKGSFIVLQIGEKKQFSGAPEASAASQPPLSLLQPPSAPLETPASQG